MSSAENKGGLETRTDTGSAEHRSALDRYDSQYFENISSEMVYIEQSSTVCQISRLVIHGVCTTDLSWGETASIDIGEYWKMGSRFLTSSTKQDTQRHRLVQIYSPVLVLYHFYLNVSPCPPENRHDAIF